jgi:hypothetical protein
MRFYLQIDRQSKQLLHWVGPILADYTSMTYSLSASTPITKHATDTYGLNRSPIRAAFQNVPINLLIRGRH